MANVPYRRLANGDWLNQANPGGPSYFKIIQSSDLLWYANFTYGEHWFLFPSTGGGFPTAAAAQTALDNYVGQLNAGTA